MDTANRPIQIGKKIVKNRITMAPTVKFDFTDDTGFATDLHVKHYEERAKAGVGLICVEATAVTPGGRFWKNHMGLWSDEQIKGHQKIVEHCKKYDTCMIIQLNHTGYVSNKDCGRPIGPSAIQMDGFDGEYMTEEMTLEEIKTMQEAFVSAAVRAKKAGYDGVQLHGCHGYLINQFVSGTYNQRSDQYGGSIENRARFCCEIIREIRKQCGEDFLISVRTTGFDDTLEDAIHICEEYVKAGCEYLQVSSGMSSLDTLKPYPDESVRDVRSLGVYFHDHFKGRVPVSCVGGINTPECVHYFLDKGYVDTVDIGRALLADPNFTKAILEDLPYKKCYQCKACQYGPFTKHQCPVGNL